MDTPGIHSEEQVAGWRQITDAVHEAGGLIAAQLWHVGRVSHESFHDGGLPVSAATAVPQPHHGPGRGRPPAPGRLPNAARARPGRDPPAAGRLPARHRERPRRRLRPRRDPRRPRLPPAPVPLRREQPARRRVRRPTGEPGPPDPRGHRRRRRRLGPTASPSASPRSARSTAPRTPRATRGAVPRPRAGRRDLAFLHLSEPDWAGGPGSTTPSAAAARSLPRPDHRGRRLRPRQGRATARGGPDRRRRLRPGLHRQPRPARRLAECRPSTRRDPTTFYGGDAEGYTDYPAYGAA